MTDPAHGPLTLNADGSFTYAPDPDFFGTESFTYKANDGTDDSNDIATVTISVTGVLDCIKTGTEGADFLPGTSGDDVICGLGGGDVIYDYQGGNDTFVGGGARTSCSPEVRAITPSWERTATTSCSNSTSP